VGIAPTGGGKTLAYALPVCEGCLNVKYGEQDGYGQGQDDENKRQPYVYRGVLALILVPTRELATQVTSVINSLLLLPPKQQQQHKQQRQQHALNTVCITGGISLQKQTRMLGKEQGEIVVGTPGRVWDLVSLLTWGG